MADDSNQALRDVVKGAGIIYAGLVVEVLVAFIAQVLAAKYLSVSGFGGLVTGTAILNLGAIFASLGFDQGLVRYLPRLDENERRVLVRRVFTITVAVSLLVGFVVSFGAEAIASGIFGDPSVTLSVRLFGAAIPFATVLSISVGGIRGQKRSLFRVYVENLLRPLLRFSLVIVAILYGLGQLGIALAYVIPYVVGAVAALWLFYRTLPAAPARTEDRYLSELTRYSLPLVLRRASGFVYRSVDIFLVLALLGSGAVGIYGVTYGFAKLVLTFSTAFNYLSGPISSEFESAGNYSGMFEMQWTVIRWITITSVMALFPMVLFPEELLGSIYKPEYVAGGRALVVLAAGFAVHNVLSTHANLLEALGRSRLLAVNSVVAAVTNVVLNILLIPEYNILGAAIATAVAYVLMDVVGTLELWYVTDEFLLPKSMVIPVFVGGVVLFAGTFVVGRLPASLLWAVVVGGLLAVAYGAVVVAIQGLNQQEVMILRSIEERYGLNLGPLDSLISRLS